MFLFLQSGHKTLRGPCLRYQNKKRKCLVCELGNFMIVFSKKERENMSTSHRKVFACVQSIKRKTKYLTKGVICNCKKFYDNLTFKKKHFEISKSAGFIVSLHM